MASSSRWISSVIYAADCTGRCNGFRVRRNQNISKIGAGQRDHKEVAAQNPDGQSDSFERTTTPSVRNRPLRQRVSVWTPLRGLAKNPRLNSLHKPSHNSLGISVPTRSCSVRFRPVRGTASRFSNVLSALTLRRKIERAEVVF